MYLNPDNITFFMEKRVTAGSAIIDKLLDGGYEAGVITTIYGPAGSGKTNLCMLCVKEIVEEGKTVIYIDTEGSFSVNRFMQVCKNYKKVLENVTIIRPVSFLEQKKALNELRKIVNDQIGLIVVDTISTFYRLEAGDGSIYEINRQFGAQLSALFELASKNNIPILVTSQVYSSMKGDDSEIRIVGGDLLRHSSKCMIELKKENSNRVAILTYHRSIPEGKKVSFKITESGISAV
jgi:DNA repair protein RadB